MSKPLSVRYENQRLIAAPSSNAIDARVHWAPLKSLWVTSLYAGAIAAATSYTSPSAILLFVITSGITLCAGHSVGMHRRLIHRSFECPQWLEHVLVYLGTLVGLGGPITMTHTHDLRDWAQRQSRCHDYFGHRQPLLKDAFWQMHCSITLREPPAFKPETAIAGNRFYRFLDSTHMAQQLPWAAFFFAIGGASWMLWGVCMRVAVSVTGHWLIGYFAHNRGGQAWRVAGAAVQGFDVDYCGLITFGECWHNNHHAYPRSAKIGLRSDQMDPGWWLVCLFAKLGWAWDIQTPETLPTRPELVSSREAVEARA